MIGVSVTADVYRLEKVIDNFPYRVGEAFAKVSTDIWAEAQVTVPRDTSHLAQSGMLTIDKTKLVTEIYYGAHYAAYVHEGTRYMRPRKWVNKAIKKHQTGFLLAMEYLEQQI